MSTNFLHGAEVLEAAGGPRPVQDPASTAIGLVGTAYGLARDDLHLVTSLRGARERYAGGGTILPAIEAIYAQGVAPPVAVVQALDPATDKTEITGEARAWAQVGTVIQLAHARVSDVRVRGPVTEEEVVDKEISWGANGANLALGDNPVKPGTLSIKVKGTNKAVPPAAYVVDEAAGEITVKATGTGYGSSSDKVLASYTWIKAPAVPVDDYEVDEAAGTISVKSVGSAADGVDVLVDYSRVDAAAVTSQEAVAAADRLLDAQSELGVLPEILIAPHFSSEASRNAEGAIDGALAATSLAAIAERLRGLAVVDGPGTSRADALAFRAAIDSRRALLVDPGVRIAAADGSISEAPASAYVAGLIARSDRDPERGWWASPSNQPLLGIAGTTRPVSFVLGDADSEANALNAADVSTIVRQGGWRLWGGRTLSSDPKWRFVPVVRTADRITRALLQSHLWAVDRNITRTYVSDVVESVNAYLRQLVSDGAILGGRCWADPDLNTPASIAEGRIYFDFDFTPAYPAERITFRSAITGEYAETIF